MGEITNRPTEEEQARQEKVLAEEERLPPTSTVHENPTKNRTPRADDPGRLEETGAGRGLDDRAGH